MDSEYQAVGIKQEVETNEINGTVNAAHMKLEQEDPTYGIQCYGIKVEPSDDTWCTTATDGNVQVKTEVKFEKLDHGEYVDIQKFEKIDTLDLNEEVDVKLEGEPSATSDCAPKKKKRVTEIQVAHTEAESELCICYSCNFRARSKTQLIKHINSGKCSAQAKMEITETETSLSCRRCFKVFKTKRTLDDHVIKMHIEFIESVSSKIHECAHCDYKTTNKNNANRHMLTHSDVIPKLCVCEHCNASFVNQLVLDNHIVQKHSKFMTTVKSYIHSCTHCTYKSTIKKYFKQHIWSHSSDKPGECKHCTATFKTKRALYEHVVKKHPDFSASITACKVYKCSYCEFKTIQKLSLDRHMVNHPNKYNPLTCKYCEATFTRKKILNDHMMKKHPDFKEAVSDKIHECSYCSYKTIVKQYLNEHMSVHSSCKPNKCKHCEASFNRKVSLDEHIVKKHPNFIASITKKIYDCSHCSYKTSIKAMFHEHAMRNHPNLLASIACKIYECPKCSYKTARKNKLDEHSLKHLTSGSSDCPFRCELCDSTYKRKRTLDNHVLKKHPDNKPTKR